MLYVIEEPLGDQPNDSASKDEVEEYRTRRDIYKYVQCLMTVCMNSDLKVQFKNTNAYDIIDELKALFEA